MPPVFAKFLALLLVLAHTGVASVRGLELCVPVGSCAGHASSAEHGHGSGGCHAHGHSHDRARGDIEGHAESHAHERSASLAHGHGLVAAHDAAHAHEDCGCHVHVAIPDQDQSPRAQGSELVAREQPASGVADLHANLCVLLASLDAGAWSGARPPWPPGIAAQLAASPRATRCALRATVILV